MMEKLIGKTVAGTSMGVGEAILFFTDGTMLTIAAEEPGPGGISDVLVTLSTYKQEKPRVNEAKWSEPDLNRATSVFSAQHST